MVIQPDTPGEIECSQLAEIGQCVVLADLLGDAVLWFAIVPFEQSQNVTLPGIAKLDDQNVVELTNGWVLHRAAVVDIDCTDDVSVAHRVRPSLRAREHDDVQPRPPADRQDDLHPGA